MRLFALSESRALGESIGAALGMSLNAHEERDFEDGEHKTRPLENVRGCEVFVIQSLYSEPGKIVNDKLCRLHFFIGALKDASARSVVAVLPYLGYARKDKKTKTRDPVTTRYVAQLLEAVGTDRVLTLDVHNLAAFQNAFRCPTDHLEAKNLFVEHFVTLAEGSDVVVVSPDVGGAKRAEQFREALSQRLSRPADSAFMEKQRSAAEQVFIVFRVLGFDEQYIADKEQELSGRDRFSVLLWCNGLDQQCRKALAGQLGIDLDDFNVTLKTLQRI